MMRSVKNVLCLIRLLVVEENDVKLAGASIFIAGWAGVADLTTVNLLVRPR